MLRTASIRLSPTPRQTATLPELRIAYADACNRLVPLVRSHRCWNRVDLHRLGYAMLRRETALGAQMCCNAIFSVCKVYRAQKAAGCLPTDAPVPSVRFNRASVHFDKRTYSLRPESISLYTLDGRVALALLVGEHQRQLMLAGSPREADLVYRKGVWYFNLIIESADVEPVTGGPVMGLDVGEVNLATASTGKVWGGGGFALPVRPTPCPASSPPVQRQPERATEAPASLRQRATACQTYQSRNEQSDCAGSRKNRRLENHR